MSLSRLGGMWACLEERSDLALAAGLVGALGLLIVPAPAVVLDGLLAVSMLGSFLLLLAAALAPKALSLSSFPTLLLLSTLLRLALNVATTRLILSTGHASAVVQAVGRFVIRGDLVVGLVVFLTVTLVQLLVIAKGAERVAEVAARFSLDALPGRQMSIDAALRAGAIDEATAQGRREELGRESQLHGAMDGAMKFVKGDAVAGLVITAINLVAGLLMGVTRRGLGWAEAIEVYAVLTVGDAVVAQVPGLAVTLAAGVLTTRVAPPEPGVALGRVIERELLGDPRALVLAAGAAFGLALLPGMPALPFLGTGALLSGLAWSARRRPGLPAQPANAMPAAASGVPGARGTRVDAERLSPPAPIALELDPVLSRALGFLSGESAQPKTELLSELVPQLRDALYLETGVRLPAVRVRPYAQGLAPGVCLIKLKEVPLGEQRVAADAWMVPETPARLRRLGVVGRPSLHPLGGAEVTLIGAADRGVVTAAGLAVWSPGFVVALHLARELRRTLRELIGLQEVAEMVGRLEKTCPTLVREVVPRRIGFAGLTEVLRRLVEEGVSIRDLESVLDALADEGSAGEDPVHLTERVRAGLGRQLAHAHAGPQRRLGALLLEPLIEDTVRAAVQEGPGGSCLALEPELARDIVDRVRATAEPVLAAGGRPVVLTPAEIRRHVRKLLEVELPNLAVLSFEELPPDLPVQPLGRVTLSPVEG